MFVLVLTSSEFELFSTLCQFRLGLQSNADIRDLSTSFTEFLQVICLLVSRSIPLISLNTGHCVAKPLDSWAALGRSPWCRGGSRADSGPPQLRFERHKRVHKVFLNMWCAQNHRRQRYKPCRNLRTPHLFHYVLMRISQILVVGPGHEFVIPSHRRRARGQERACSQPVLGNYKWLTSIRAELGPVFLINFRLGKSSSESCNSNLWVLGACHSDAREDIKRRNLRANFAQLLWRLRSALCVCVAR